MMRGGRGIYVNTDTVDPLGRSVLVTRYWSSLVYPTDNNIFSLDGETVITRPCGA